MFVKKSGLSATEASALLGHTLEMSVGDDPSSRETEVEAEYRVFEDQGKFRAIGTMTVHEYPPGSSQRRSTVEGLRTNRYDTREEADTAAKLMADRRAKQPPG